jgi:hypothetical protein
MQGLAKGEHISLCRRIGRVAGNGLERQEAGDEKDMSGSPLSHIAAEEIGQLGERRDIQLNHVDGLLDRRFQKIAVQTVAGIVHQDVDRYRLRIEVVFRAAGRAGLGQINRLDHHIHPVFSAEIGCKLFHRLLPSRRQYEIDLLRRQQICKLNAQAARCPRDQSPLSREAIRFNVCTANSHWRSDRFLRHSHLSVVYLLGCESWNSALALTPPKPKPLQIACCIWIGRASFATKSSRECLAGEYPASGPTDRPKTPPSKRGRLPC